MSAKILRRGFGLACLSGALGLLIAGELGATAHLSLAGVALYWMLCLALTAAAFATALWDARIVQREARAARRELFRQTFGSLGLRETGMLEDESSGRGDSKGSKPTSGPRP